MDVIFIEAVSIYDGANYIKPSSPIHKPCPDMEGLKNYDPDTPRDSAKTKRAHFLISKLREKHGIKKRVKPESKPLTYICTDEGCVEPWGAVSNAYSGEET